MADRRRDFEVVVLGGGPAGIAAACAAAADGARVAILDNTPWLGGPIWRPRGGKRLPRAARQWQARLADSGSEVFLQTTAQAIAGPGVLLAESPTGVLKVGWTRLILATGAQELFLPFPGWTLPNVLGVGGLQLLGKTGWPIAGKRVVVAGTGPLPLAVAAYLVRAGAHVTDVLEQAPWQSVARFALALPGLAPTKLVEAVGFQRSLLGVRYRTGCWPLKALGGERVERIEFGNGTRTWSRDCDYLACAYGLVPSTQWSHLLGCEVGDDATVVDRYQQTTVPGIFSAGEATGVGGVECSLIEGQIAGHAAMGQRSAAERLFSTRARLHRFAAAIKTRFALRDELKSLATADTVVCRCEDVTWQDIESFADVRSAKLQTRCGMGPCQGRVCHPALRLIKGWQTDRVRPPILPARVGALAGQSEARHERV